MTAEQRVFVAVLVVVVLLFVLRSVHKSRLGVTVGILWTLLLFAALILLAMPGALETIRAITRAKYAVSAVTLLAFFVVVVYLLYLSMLAQRFERKHTQLVRAIALMERNLRMRQTETLQPDIEDDAK